MVSGAATIAAPARVQQHARTVPAARTVRCTAVGAAAAAVLRDAVARAEGAADDGADDLRRLRDPVGFHHLKARVPWPRVRSAAGGGRQRHSRQKAGVRCEFRAVPDDPRCDGGTGGRLRWIQRRRAAEIPNWRAGGGEERFSASESLRRRMPRRRTQRAASLGLSRTIRRRSGAGCVQRRRVGFAAGHLPVAAPTTAASSRTASAAARRNPGCRFLAGFPTRGTAACADPARRAG